MDKVHFEWNSDKDKINQKKHDVSFGIAQYAFLDPNRIIAKDLKHSGKEERYFCIGKVNDEIITDRKSVV